MAETIVPQVLRLVRFPKRPSIRVGDKIVLYVLGFDGVFGIVEVFTPVRPGDGDNPWDKWFLDVREVMSLPYAESPSIDALSSPVGISEDRFASTPAYPASRQRVSESS